MTQNYTSMDHKEVMNSLVLFMRAQDEFKDFNFDGSAIREFLRVLAYNAQNQAFQNNFIFNELQHDSAQLRPNLVSLVSRLGYIPSSKRSARMSVNISVKPNDLATATSSIVMPRETNFYATKDGSAFIFSPDREYIAHLINGEYVFSNVVLLQGVWAINAFNVQVDEGFESYIIPNQNVDTNTLEVVVRPSDTSGDQTKFNQFRTAYDLGGESNIYFLRENRNGFYEFKFGDGKFAKKLNYGNVVTARYLVTEGLSGNNLSNIVPASGIAGHYNIQLVRVDQYSYGGSEVEDMESIRTLAPLGFTASDNAVTAGDYVSITKKIFPEASDAIAWGGEDNDPPRYGYSFVSIKPKSSERLSDSQKKYLLDELKKYNVGAVTPIIVDPTYTFINVKSTIKFDTGMINTTVNSLQAKVIDQCRIYSKDKMEKFGGKLELSKFVEFLNEVDNSVVGNFTRISYEKRFNPILNTEASYAIKFYHELEKGTLVIDNFRVSDANFDSTTSYKVVDNNGLLDLVSSAKGATKVLIANVGIVDYKTGEVAITRFRPSVVLGEYVRVSVEPSRAQNIDSSIIAFNNNILAFNNLEFEMVQGKA